MARDLELAVALRAKDELSKPVATAGQNVADAIDKIAKSDDKLAESSKRVEQATTARVSASKAAELAIVKEAEADDKLQHAIARVNEAYARARAEVQRQIRDSGQVSESTLKAAAEIREMGERLRIVHGTTQQYLGPLNDMIKGFGALAGPIIGARVAFNALQGVLAATKVDLTDGVTTLERAAFALNETKDLPKLFEGAVPVIGGLIDDVGRLAVATYGFFANTAEIAAKELEDERSRTDALKMRNAMLALIDEETKKAIETERKGEETRQKNIAILGQMEHAADERRKKNAEARKQAAAELANMDADLAAKAQAAADQLAAKQVENAAKVQEAREKHAARAASVEVRVSQQMDAIHEQNVQRRVAIENAAYEQQRQLVQGIGSELGNAMGAFIQGTERADKILAKMLINIAATAAKVAIVSALGQGIAGAFGVGIAGGVFGGIASLFAEGGWVEGGVKGRDSVKAMLMPGEYVASVKDIDAARRDPGAAARLMQRIIGGPSGTEGSIRDPMGATHFADGGFVGATRSRNDRGRGGRAGVTLIFQNLQQPNSRELDAFLRVMMPRFRELQRQGHG